MKKMMSSWSARNLTLVGKIAILKSLVVSQIVYLLSSLPSPPGVMKEINMTSSGIARVIKSKEQK